MPQEGKHVKGAGWGLVLASASVFAQKTGTHRAGRLDARFGVRGKIGYTREPRVKRRTKP